MKVLLVVGLVSVLVALMVWWVWVIEYRTADDEPQP